ncbi:MAG: FHA domain-containing protein [Clostridia bacterium]|nr:FHA domain-containing protein [Clostridia bacterium]
MKIVKCINGHFYDSTAYEVCPHCGGSVSQQSESSSRVETRKPKKGLFGKKSSTIGNSIVNESTPINKEKIGVQAPIQYSDQFVQRENIRKNNDTALPHNVIGNNTNKAQVNMPQTYIDEDATVSIMDANAKRIDNSTHMGAINAPNLHYDVVNNGHNPIGNDGINIIDDGQTINFWSDNVNIAAKDPSPAANEHNNAVNIAMPAAPVADKREYVNNYDSVSPDPNLKDIVQQASANEEGKTMSFFTAKTASTEQPKTEKPDNKPQTELIVGWLVCVKGDHFGMSFTLSAGMNSIGRNSNNKIALYKSNTVSRDKHALLTYEPRQRAFYVKPGDSSGLTYINGEYVTEMRTMKARDIIELGNNSLMLIPLCDETFTWEDYI